MSVLCGDCRDVLPTIPRDTVDLVIIDPPYNAGNEFANDNMSVENFLDFMESIFFRIWQTMKDGASFYCFINEGYVFDFKRLLDVLFNFRRLITWEFEPSYRCVDDNYYNLAEYVLYYTKGEPTTFNVVRTDTSESTVKRWQQYADENGNIPYDKLTPSFKRRYKRENYDKHPINIYRGTPLSNVIHQRRVKDNDDEAKYGRHITQKPVALLEQFILESSNPGDTVLDCFCGAGSTLVAAKKNRRNYVGIDVDEGYIEIAKKRLADIRLTERL